MASKTTTTTKDLPAGVATGVAIFDEYLAEIDARLWGAESVRLHTLLEIKDHLLERKLHAASTSDDEAAARSAVAELGPAERHATAQRSILARKFMRRAVIVGIPWLVLMLGFAGSDSGARRTAASWLSLAICYAVSALGMAWWMTFRRASARVPEAWADPSQGFEVALPKRAKLISVLLAGWLTYDFVDRLLRWDLSFGFYFMLGMTLTFYVIAFRGMTSSFRVDDRGFWVNRVIGSTYVPWTQVKRLSEPRYTRWLHTWARDERKASIIEYADDKGTKRHAWLLPEMANVGSFVTLLHQRRSPPFRDRLL